MAGRPKEKTVEAIDRLLAFEDLRNLKARYLQYLDSKQWDKYASLFVEDGVFSDAPTFDTDALVNDVQREFAGAEAIRAFAAKEIFGDRVTFTPVRAVDRHGDITVHARTDGTYDKTTR
jgi:hypothetical protein